MNFSRCTLSANSGSSLAAKQDSRWSSGCVSKLAQNSQGNLLFISLHFQPTPSCFTSYAVWLLLCPFLLRSALRSALTLSVRRSVRPCLPACLPPGPSLSTFLLDPPHLISSVRPSVLPSSRPSPSFSLPSKASPNVAPLFFPSQCPLDPPSLYRVRHLAFPESLAPCGVARLARPPAHPPARSQARTHARIDEMPS